MPFKFTNQPLQEGLYEPEGIYLNLPYAGSGVVLQPFGGQEQHIEPLTYNGVPLRGHNGVDFGVSPSSILLAVDKGRVAEISYDPCGLGRYIKVTHEWGESLYALIGDATVDSGHRVERAESLGRVGDAFVFDGKWSLLHFSIRILPFNRFDGWGGYTNPINYFSADDLQFPDPSDSEALVFPLHQLKSEPENVRRP